ncbi:hypothetical protein SH2C18_45430 [Clostridium sediminicola]|uniref:hypothetical protein n=1 Tax=Clostridium sediminicola TaxID=3114879 RepID=UPI0031F21F29
MIFNFRLPEKNSPEIVVKTSIWSKPKIFVNNIQMKRLKEKGKPYSITMSDGTIRKIFMKLNPLDPVPRIFFGNNEILLAKKLLWYEYLIGGFPLILIIIGGALGGAIGVTASVFNFNIFRKEYSLFTKILLTTAITIISFTAYLTVATIFFKVI